MKHSIFRYLDKINLSDTAVVNRLFISAFQKEERWNFQNNHITGLLNQADIDNIDTDNFTAILKKSGYSFSFENLIELFEFVISPADRIVTGAVYTPGDIRKTIINRCLEKYTDEQLKNIRIADIACGCGGFLMDAAIYIHEHTGKDFYDIYIENLFGIDIQDYSLERTKIILELLAYSYGEDRAFQFNLLHADTLDFKTADWPMAYSGFDVIVGNPPYSCSRNVSKETKEKMRNYSVCISGHPDLYIPFFQIAVEMLSDNGILGYITMNSFFRSVNGRAVRKFFSDSGFDITLIDFRDHQMFRSRNTYTCLFFLDKSIRNHTVHYMLNETGDLTREQIFNNIEYDKLNDFQGWLLNSHEKALHFESAGIPIRKYCSSRHGIATLSNDIYIFMPVKEDEVYYYIKKKDATYCIEKNICRDIVNSNRLNSETAIQAIAEKVIFPYLISQDGKACIIDEDIMKTEYPKTYAYLKSQRETLYARDKGNGEKYPVWYQYGRTQSLTMPRYKLFFPKIADKPLNCILCDDKNLLLYNGMAFVSDNMQTLQILKRIIESTVFWEYITLNSKPYSAGYYALSGINIKNFCIPDFDEKAIMTLLSFNDKNDIDNFLRPYYRENT